MITNLTVKNNGLLHVEEQCDYSFDEAFNEVYRNIPLKSGESIENIKIHIDGAYSTYEEVMIMDINIEKFIYIPMQPILKV